MHPVYLNFYFAGIYIKYGPILSIEGETILQQGIEQCFISHRYSTWGLRGAGNFILTPTEGHMNRESDSDSPARDCCLWPLSLTLLQGLNLLLNLPLQ